MRYLFALCFFCVMFSLDAYAQQDGATRGEREMAIDDSISLIRAGDTVSTGLKYLEFEKGRIGIGHLVNWKREGWWTFLRADSSKVGETEYENGIRTEERVYDLNGKLLADCLVPETEPSFIGGERAWINYIDNQLSQNRERLNGVRGQKTVEIGFMVEKNGKIDQVSILNSSGTVLDNVAIEVVKRSPAWTPASTGDVHVAAYAKRVVTVTNLSTINNDSLFLSMSGDTLSSGFKIFRNRKTGKYVSGTLKQWKRVGTWTVYADDAYMTRQLNINMLWNVNSDEAAELDTLKVREMTYDLGECISEKVFDTKGNLLAEFQPPDSAATFTWKGSNWTEYFSTKFTAWAGVVHEKRGVGLVDVGFMVEKDGTVDHISLIRRTGTVLDKVVLDIVSKSPRWQPAIKDHKPVPVYLVWGVLSSGNVCDIYRAPAYLPTAY